MSLPKPDLHIRISEDAMVALRAVTCAERGEDFPVATMAADLLEEKLLGRTHTIKVAVRLDLCEVQRKGKTMNLWGMA